MCSNKQVPDSSGSNEKRFLKGRSPAFFRHKRVRACYGYTGHLRTKGTTDGFPQLVVILISIESHSFPPRVCTGPITG